MAARSVAAPGVSGQDVDRAARKVIENAGYGEWFFHRTGHGIGLRVHEDPNMVAGNAEPLEPGNVFSVEPGIYLAGRFGVRIENIVTVTGNGCESLNAEPSPTLLPIA
jgi:Xaa-Pro dipeptidase